MPAGADTWIAVRLVIVAAVLAASLFAGALLIPWGQDNSFSRMNMPPSENTSTNVLAAKIWDEPKYRDAYLAR